MRWNGAEEMGRDAEVEARAVVAHEEDPALFAVDGAHFHVRRGVRRGELPGVAEELAEDDAHEARVGLRRESGCDGEVDGAPRVLRGQLFAHLFRDAREVGRLAHKVVAGHA